MLEATKNSALQIVEATGIGAPTPEDEARSQAKADSRRSLYSFTRSELGDYLHTQFNAPRYHATNIFQWVYRRGVTDFAEMTDLSRVLREELPKHLVCRPVEFLQRELSTDGSRKYLIPVGADKVESVMIAQPKRKTLCVSSQVGCGMGCKFCRTATMGFRRHLKVEEIIHQVVTVRDDCKNFDDQFTNIVFMGMGEPLHNFKEVAKALDILTDDKGLGFAPRKITVSTVGLVPAIEEFGALGKANLAVSLNATTDEIRAQVMPVNKAYPLEKLVGALRRYPVQRRKRITIEYVMLHGVNDTEADLARLPKLLKGVPAKLNLIPYNENAGLGFKSPPREWISYWSKALHELGMEVTVRWSKGADISAACGQLATASKRNADKAPQATA